MEPEVLRTCEILKFDEVCSSCELQYFDNKYHIVLLFDYDDIFFDFECELDGENTKEYAIKYFEEYCMGFFTSFGGVTMDEIIEYGEDIKFF
jgi:hypothetical protein